MDNDHTTTTREVLDHLAASGARRIALHSGYGREFYTGAVTSAYEQWCAERGLAPLLVPFDPDDTAGHAFDSAFTGPDRPDAVYCVYDPGAARCWPPPRATVSVYPAYLACQVCPPHPATRGMTGGCCWSARARIRRTPRPNPP